MLKLSLSVEWGEGVVYPACVRIAVSCDGLLAILRYNGCFCQVVIVGKRGDFIRSFVLYAVDDMVVDAEHSIVEGYSVQVEGVLLSQEIFGEHNLLRLFYICDVGNLCVSVHPAGHCVVLTVHVVVFYL